MEPAPYQATELDENLAQLDEYLAQLAKMTLLQHRYVDSVDWENLQSIDPIKAAIIALIEAIERARAEIRADADAKVAAKAEANVIAAAVLTAAKAADPYDDIELDDEWTLDPDAYAAAYADAARLPPSVRVRSRSRWVW